MSLSKYHAALQACVNGDVGGCGLLGVVRRASRFRFEIMASAADLSAPPAIQRTETLAPQRIVFDRYQGRNANVLSMMEFLTDHSMYEDVICAVVHGSLALNDEVAYSDFDALLIVRDETLMDPERLGQLSQCATRARCIMHQQDPLQHHGWFVLPEFMLRCYPETFLPIATLRESVSLGATCELEVHPVYGGSSFDGLASSTTNEICSGRFLKNLYLLKSCLSKFMLLPAAFVQAKFGCGITKGESFERIRDTMGDLSAVMDQVTRIRANWTLPKGSVLRLVAGSPLLLRSVGTKRIAPRIPTSLRSEFTNVFQSAMLAYVRKMSALLTEKTPVMAS